jgi:hypothetical protein
VITRKRNGMKATGFSFLCPRARHGRALELDPHERTGRKWPGSRGTRSFGCGVPIFVEICGPELMGSLFRWWGGAAPGTMVAGRAAWVLVYWSSW